MRRRIAQVELCRTHGIGLHPDSEHLALYTIDNPWKLFRKNFIQAFLQAQPGRQAVRRNVLISVRNPYIAEDRRPQLLGDIGRNPPAADPVLYPESSYSFIRRRECEIVPNHGMAEKGGIKVDTDVISFGKFHPFLKVTGLQGISIRPFAGF